MTELPVCRWREGRGGETLRCHSAKFVAPPNPVAAEYCRDCVYVDHAPTLPPSLLSRGSLGGWADELLPAIGGAGECLRRSGLPPIYCITCSQTPERTAKASSHFRERGLDVQFFPGIHGETFGLRTVLPAGADYYMPAGHVGLVLSHYMLWQTLAYLPHEEILILEDDAYFDPDFPARFQEAYADLPPDWQFVFVGSVATEGKSFHRISARVGILRYPCGTHAYLVKRSILPFLLRTNHQARNHIDLQLIENSLPALSCYTFTPSLVKQRGVCSAVDGTGENWPTMTAVADAPEADGAAPQIGPTGFWRGTEDFGHHFDGPLSEALAELFAGHTVADLGCGDGSYVRALHGRGIDCDGYDGNPATPAFHPLCKVLDLSAPARLPRLYDWSLSLEVGEHIPAAYEDAFLDNLYRHNRKGIVLSWAVPGQGGHGHCNERDNEYVRHRMRERGYRSDPPTEQRLRGASRLPWFEKSLMVFVREDPS